MTLEELLQQALPIARRAAEHQVAMSEENRKVTALINEHHAAIGLAADGEAEAAAKGFYTALTALAHLEIGNADPESAARTVAAALDVRELHERPASLAVRARKRIEMMLLARLRAHVEGN